MLMSAPSSVHEIADALLVVADRARVSVSLAKLHALVYYAHAWHLARTEGVPLFDAAIEAHVQGPVVPAVEARFASMRWTPGVLVVEAPVLHPDITSHLEEILGTYGHYSAWELARLTHDELPWLEARGGLPGDAACTRAIRDETMQTCYAARLDTPVAAGG